MKRILLPLMAMSIALTSCSRDNDDVTNPTNPPTTNPATPPTNPVEQRKKIRGISIELPNFDIYQLPDDAFPFLSANLFYNGDLLTSIDPYDVIYDRDLIVSLNNGATTFTYNSNGTIKSSIQKINHYLNPTEISREYTYINNETIKVREVKKSRNQDDVIKEHTLTIYNDNLVSKETIDLARPHIKEVHTYSYDDRENPIRRINGFSSIAIEIDFLEGNPSLLKAFKNNITKIEKHYRYTNYDTPVNDLENYPTMTYDFFYLRDNEDYNRQIFVTISKESDLRTPEKDWEYEYKYNVHYYGE